MLPRDRQSDIHTPWHSPAPSGDKRFLVVLLGLFIGLGIFYSVKTPAFETPDEIWHFAFIHHLASGQGLPVSEADTQALWQQQGVQAPGYYLAAAALTAWVDMGDFPDVFARSNPHRAIGAPHAQINRNYLLPYPADGWPWQGTFLALHLVRLFSVLLGAVTLWATYRALCLIVPVGVARFGVASFAFIPQFIFVSAAVSNDNGVNALAALVLWRVVALIMSGQVEAPAPGSSAQRRDFLLLGVLLGVAALTKLSALGLIGIAGLAVLAHGYQQRDWHILVAAAVWIGAPALLVGGWWYARNWLLYGDLLAWNIWQANILLRVAPAGTATILGELGSLEQSFWGLFGWLNVPYPEMIYSFFRSLSWLVAAGLLAGAVRWARRNRRLDRRFWAGALLIVWGIVLFISWARFMQIAPAAQGRYFFPAAPTLALLLGLGLHGWRLWTLPWLVVVLLFGLSLFTPQWIIAPAYTPQLATIEEQMQLHPIDAQFGDRFRVRGLAAEPRQVAPGDTATVIIEWEALAPPNPTDTVTNAPTNISITSDSRDYSVFVHLVDQDGLIIAQLDTIPGGGLLPTSQWHQDTLFTEAYSVYIPPTAYTPNRARWAVGLYGGEYVPHVGPIGGGRLPVTLVTETSDDQALSIENREDALVFGPAEGMVEILAPAGMLPNALHARFEGGMWLESYTLAPRVLHPGETLVVMLYWRSERVPPQDYTVFVHLLDEALDGAGGADRTPDLPTTQWTPEQVYAHHHPIIIPPDLAPGYYRLAVGMYSMPGFSRLGLEDAGSLLGVHIQAEGADRYLLGPVRVLAESVGE